MYIVCVIIITIGEPSPPANLSITTPNNIPSTTIKWDAPLYRGQGIAKYTIKIPSINYVTEDTNTSLTRNYHIIAAEEGTGVKFNTLYAVEVSTVGVCGSESEPANVSVRIEATGE